jgi:hypothetical protein
MIIKMLTILFYLVLDLLAVFKMTDSDKDLEIVILRQQVRILQRKAKTTPRLTDPERMVLAMLTDKFKRAKTGTRQRLDQVIMIFKPETMLRWHRELVRRKWTYKRKGKPGRPRITAELEALIVRLAKENTRWGYEKIQGELLKLGYTLCPSTVGNILKRHGITPACERSNSSWRKFLGHYMQQMLACDFFRGRNLRSQNRLRSVLHRTGHPTHPSGRLHHEPQHHLGYPTSTQPDLGSGGRSSTQSLSHSGQRQEVSRSFRHGLHFTRHRDCDDPLSSPSGERLCFILHLLRTIRNELRIRETAAISKFLALELGWGIRPGRLKQATVFGIVPEPRNSSIGQLRTDQRERTVIPKQLASRSV